MTAAADHMRQDQPDSPFIIIRRRAVLPTMGACLQIAFSNLQQVVRDCVSCEQVRVQLVLWWVRVEVPGCEASGGQAWWCPVCWWETLETRRERSWG